MIMTNWNMMNYMNFLGGDNNIYSYDWVVSSTSNSLDL
jgi:hypothetical protein